MANVPTLTCARREKGDRDKRELWEHPEWLEQDYVGIREQGDPASPSMRGQARELAHAGVTEKEVDAIT